MTFVSSCYFTTGA